MPRAADFRNYAFDAARIDSGGKDLGRKIYWKLYAAENIVRVIVHSVLIVQANPNWWPIAVDPGMQQKVAKFRTQYAKQPWHSTPGKHDIYYTFLSDLNEIIRANANLFRPIIPDIDNWIAKIETVRLPRNIVGHMNWLTTTDRKRIDVFYDDLQQLVKQLATNMFSFVIP